ncbi:MAG: response regulator, partial [Sphingomonadales bacterium]
HNRERYISWTLTRSGERMFGVGRDDTALIEAEETLRQSQKMEAVGQLTGGIAHDFNNLLTIVLGNLDIARRERLAARPLDPASQIGIARELIERAVGETVEVSVECAGGCWPVLADPVQLESALLNLAVNARDAMSEGGRLLLSTANVPLGAAAAAERRLKAGDYVRLTVSDTGAGMPPEVVARVFEPFFTTKAIGKGTGLGLSQVHGFVLQSGGAVSIESAPGRGTSVHLWLPRSAVSPREPTMPPRALPPLPVRAGTRVLVVEDNDALRELVVTTLRDAGYRVLEAHDGASGLALFQRQERTPDIVLSDIQMPNMDGLALSRAIRQRAPSTRVLLMTGYADQVDGAGDDLLVKPFTPDVLLARVQAMAG